MERNMSYEEEVQAALEEFARAQKKMDQLTDRFYVENERSDIYGIIDLIIEKGNPRNREFLEEFKKKYDDGSIKLEDIEHYQDLRDQHQKILI